MRERRTWEELAEPLPIMYRRNRRGLFFNCRGENVTDRMLSSFPWDKDADGEFEWKHGWTKFRQFYVDGILTREEMDELINERFPHVVVQ